MKEKSRKRWKKIKKGLSVVYISIVLLGTLAFPAFAFNYSPDIICLYLGHQRFESNKLASLLSYTPEEDITMSRISCPEEAAQTAFDTWKISFSREMMASINMPYLISYVSDKDLWYVHSTLPQFDEMKNWAVMGKVAHVFIRGSDGKVISVFYG